MDPGAARSLLPRRQPRRNRRRGRRELHLQRRLGVAQGGVMRDIIYAVIAAISVLVTLQSAHPLYLTLYTWNRPPYTAHAVSTMTRREGPGIVLTCAHRQARATSACRATRSAGLDPEPQ